MNPTSIKYFHYFIACLCLDLLVIYGMGMFFDIKYLYVLIVIWIISNFVNYPRIASRRFISYYQLLLITTKQFITFLAFWALSLIILQTFEFQEQLYAPLIVLYVFGGRILFVSILRLYRMIGRGYNRFYMIGNSPTMAKIRSNFLSKKSHGYIFEGESDEVNITFLKKMIVDNHLNEIYCSSKFVHQNDLSDLLGLALHYGINVHVVSDINNVSGSEDVSPQSLLFYSELDLEDFPLIDRKNLIFKRAFDIIFSSIVILTLVWWVTIILAIFIKIESKGPVFFKQPRSGRQGKYFMCFKFRSMRLSNIEKQATKNDNRITKVGSLIRKLSIDELPQFVNVLLGEMSVVGPRPHIKLLNDKYGTAINNYDSRMLVKPGITGLSQVSGLRGETEEDSSMINRVKVDMVYIKTWSLYKDITIIVRTIFDVLFMRDRNAF